MSPAPTRRTPTERTPTGGAAADRLRHKIDEGGTQDKVDHPDPAAAPLGTDAEAAGTPTDPAAMERAAARETARPPAEAPAEPRDGHVPSPDRTPADQRHRLAMIWLGLVLGMGAMLVFAVLAAG
jgi:hypothetical protein